MILKDTIVNAQQLSKHDAGLKTHSIITSIKQRVWMPNGGHIGSQMVRLPARHPVTLWGKGVAGQRDAPGATLHI